MGLDIISPGSAKHLQIVVLLIETDAILYGIRFSLPTGSKGVLSRH